MDDFPGTPESSEESQAQSFLLPLFHNPLSYAHFSTQATYTLSAVISSAFACGLSVVWMENSWCPLYGDMFPGDLNTVVHFLTFSGRNYLLDILKGLTG